MGNAAGSLFLRALDQGERTYTSMCCRGYSVESKTYYEGKPLGAEEWFFLIVSGGYLIIFPSLLYLVL
jgi:cobalt/nickel transport system permease protein